MSTKSDSSVPERSVSLELVAGLVTLAIVSVFIFSAGDVLLDWVFPLVLGYAAGIIGVYLVIRGLLGYGEKLPAVPAILRGKGADVAVFVLFAFLYAALARPVGFWIMSWFTIFAASLYLDEGRGPKRAVRSAVIALGICVFGYWLFSRVFFVPFPRATWLGL